ncbi:phosphoribosylanthranilate isomerase [bacterium 210820-DFI.6.52]|nr:phosphoribosylanthranilate isomerase [bacterium 210820-DFI.6.52]
MIKQIYPIVSLTEANACLKAGVTVLGLNPVAHPRGSVGEITYARAQQIIDGVGDRCKVVVIALENDPQIILEKARLLQPDILHISGDQFCADRELVAACKRELPFMKIMQAVQVTDVTAIERAKAFGRFVDYLILDTGSSSNKGIGASGCTHDWNISRQIVDSCGVPVVLAGGLGCDNVQQAICKVRPWGVDSMTKTNCLCPDGEHAKDLHQVELFCRLADGASPQSFGAPAAEAGR